MTLRTMAPLTIAPLTIAPLTIAPLTIAPLTMALRAMAPLTMAPLTMTLLTMIPLTMIPLTYYGATYCGTTYSGTTYDSTIDWQRRVRSHFDPERRIFMEVAHPVHGVQHAAAAGRAPAAAEPGACISWNGNRGPPQLADLTT
jgi:hypothetical protein